MYCANCGAKSSGNFCSACGARLSPVEKDPIDPKGWNNESRYKILLQYVEVRDLIERHTAQCRTAMSGEDFLDLCDKAFAPLVGVPLVTVANIAVPIHSRLGIQTGKNQSKILSAPIGKVIVAILCSLAKRGRSLKHVHQGEDGCVIEEELPSDMWSWKGELVITVRRASAGVEVEAATMIPGQIYDWGKSKKCLSQLFEDLESSLN